MSPLADSHEAPSACRRECSSSAPIRQLPAISWLRRPISTRISAIPSPKLSMLVAAPLTSWLSPFMPSASAASALGLALSRAASIRALMASRRELSEMAWICFTRRTISLAPPSAVTARLDSSVTPPPRLS